MRRIIRRLLPVLAITAVAGCMPAPPPQAASAPEAAYPLLLPQMRLHDPFIVADAATGTYHLFTRNEPSMTGERRLGTMAYTSRDLRHWSAPRVVFTLPPGTWADGGAWAPEVHQWRGRWYLFTTFHNEGAALPVPTGSKRRPHRRGTVMAVADSPAGPFTLANGGEPVVSAELMTLDGTLHVDRQGRPWFVYAHEWLQTVVGTIEAVPLDDELRPAGEPRLLFRANEAGWAQGQKQPEGDTVWVTDGPQFWRTPGGALMMLWSSYGEGGYVQALARSANGEVTGPWEQLGPLVTRDSGHGMLFRAFDDRLMMVLHRPFTRALGKLYEMRELPDRVEVAREAVELDLEAYPTHR